MNRAAESRPADKAVVTWATRGQGTVESPTRAGAPATATDVTFFLRVMEWV
jgi:hypothetical protein